MEDQEHYAEFVRSRVKDPATILTQQTPAKLGLLHPVLGLAGEFFELQIALLNNDEENLLEELSDMEFYLQDLFTQAGVQPTGREYKAGSGFVYMTRLGPHVGEVLDLVKKHVIYDQDLNRKALEHELHEIRAVLSAFERDRGHTPTEVRQFNEAKLRKRYKHEYSDAQASARADKQ